MNRLSRDLRCETHMLEDSSIFTLNSKGFHCRAKPKTSLEDDDVPIDDTTIKPLFTPQEKGRK
ncbi:hypothetical protein LAZ67_X003407, partial [Cordylochernes scorpioides]